MPNLKFIAVALNVMWPKVYIVFCSYLIIILEGNSLVHISKGGCYGMFSGCSVVSTVAELHSHACLLFYDYTAA